MAVSYRLSRKKCGKTVASDGFMMFVIFDRWCDIEQLYFLELFPIYIPIFIEKALNK